MDTIMWIHVADNVDSHVDDNVDSHGAHNVDLNDGLLFLATYQLVGLELWLVIDTHSVLVVTYFKGHYFCRLDRVNLKEKKSLLLLVCACVCVCVYIVVGDLLPNDA